ncbi:hypothetical protein ACF0H5_010028 [Mactra antiquata]
MALSGSILKTSEETFDFICTSCTEDNLIKEALKYCVECQKYCCKDCLTYHRRFALLKGHTFLDNSSVKLQGQPSSLPAFPTKQCSQHIGKIMDMFCKTHDVVCCYVCVAEDHASCKDKMSVSDNINRLYNKTDTSRATYKLGYILDDMNQWKANTDTLLKQLRDSKTTAIKAVSDYRIEMEKFLKKLEEASIKEIEDQYQTLESQILAERQRYEDSIDELKNLKQLLTQASGNIAQLFVCSKLAEKKCTTLGDDEMERKSLKHAEVKFVPSEQLKSSIEKMKNLGETSAISSRTYNLYKVTKIRDMKVRLKEDTSKYNCSILGSCIIDDTVIFTDWENNKLKRFDISSSSLIDYCEVPGVPFGVCRVGEREVAVACGDSRVHFVSIHNKLSLLRSIQMNHGCYGIAYSNDKLYITDEDKSLYMCDMSGNILKTVTSDNSGQPIFECSNRITFNDKKDRLFVGDDEKGLVCFNAECDYIETVTDSDVRPIGVCTDGYGNVIVANYGLQTIVQCSRDGQKCGIIVNKTRGNPRSVSIHHGLRKMFVGYWSDTVEVYNLTWKSD